MPPPYLSWFDFGAPILKVMLVGLILKSYEKQTSFLNNGR